ncbi:MAG: hypothetical protein JO069_01320, partial [Verrucomicrobia bacterium]|nr:hypothetical protein [Verrucomicrobiota bacterium]
MIDALFQTCGALVDRFAGVTGRRDSCVRRHEMPNGFFLNDLLWFGDGASRRTAVARGFSVEPGEINAFSVRQLNDLHERLRTLLGILGNEHTLQVQWSIDSDYRQELEDYHRETLELRRQDPIHGQFGVLVRAERYERYKAAMEEGRLRRERLTLFFCRVLDTDVPVSGPRAVIQYFDTLSRKESLALQELGLGTVSRLFPDCLVRPLGDQEHFLYCYRFLNADLAAPGAGPLEIFDPAYSIQQNCLHAEGITHPSVPASSFRLGGHHHAIFAVRQWPRRTFPGLISTLTSMGFQEYAVTLNVYPKSLEKVIDAEEKSIQRLQIDAISERKQSLVADLSAKQEKVTELQQGKVIPLDCLYVVRLWHRNADALASRCATLRNAFTAMGGAVVHHASIPENARRLFYQIWPGWTFG